MRFDCGETFEEMKRRLGQWHRWFAWYPVRISDHDCRWLGYVERRGEYHPGIYDEGWRWYVRPLGGGQ